MIYIPDSSKYEELTVLWERSVRATHHFLTENDISEIRFKLKRDYLPAVKLYCLKDAEGQITAFMGISDCKLEMLFVDPDHFRQGLGQMLLRYATEELLVNEVDVNEANPSAVEFYRRMGFTVAGRSETDTAGRPFPLLHMKLISSTS